jgi:hypothetical protein
LQAICRNAAADDARHGDEEEWLSDRISGIGGDYARWARKMLIPGLLISNAGLGCGSLRVGFDLITTLAGFSRLESLIPRLLMTLGYAALLSC